MHRLISFGTGLLLALSMAACTFIDPAGPADTLAALPGSWELIEIIFEEARFDPEPDRLGGRRPDLWITQDTTRADALSVAGYLGCNLFSGSAGHSGSTFVIESLITTEIACQEYPAAIEAAYLEGLQTTTTYTFVGDFLVLSGSRGHLSFRPRR
jgi:heat shock protein HslJ